MGGPHEGRVAVVTGAAAGLGQAYAIRMARDGASVIVADRDDGAETVETIRAAGGEAHFVACDVSSEEAVTDLQARSAELLGPCDVLINNTGISPNKAVGRANVPRLATGDLRQPRLDVPHQ